MIKTYVLVFKSNVPLTGQSSFLAEELQRVNASVNKNSLSQDAVSGSDTTSHNKIDKPLVGYRFCNVTL